MKTVKTSISNVYFFLNIYYEVSVHAFYTLIDYNTLEC